MGRGGLFKVTPAQAIATALRHFDAERKRRRLGKDERWTVKVLRAAGGVA